MMTRHEPENSPKPYPIATSLENVMQQPENTITTCASAETQKLIETLTTTTSRRSRSKGEVVVGGGAAELKNVEEEGGGLTSRSTEEEEGSDLDP
jgi:hypothetical protein